MAADWAMASGDDDDDADCVKSEVLPAPDENWLAESVRDAVRAEGVGCRCLDEE